MIEAGLSKLKKEIEDEEKASEEKAEAEEAKLKAEKAKKEEEEKEKERAEAEAAARKAKEEADKEHEKEKEKEKETKPEEPKPAEPEPEPAKEKKKSTAKPGELQVDGVGMGMMDEMQEYLDDGKVQFGLVMVPMGSGTFTRNKMIFVQWTGANCTGMKKAKAVQKSGEVGSLFGATHATYTIDGEREECSLDSAVEELKSVFVTDSGNFSTAQLRADIEQRIKDQSPASPTSRKTAKDLGLSENTVLKELRKNLGAFNWCLLEPSPDPIKMFNAGSKSICEMHEYLEEDKVLYGLIRLGFGTGAYRRTKWVCVTFVGENVGAMARGRMVSCRGQMENILKPYSVTIEVHGKEEATIEAILDKVKNFIVSDEFDKTKVTVEEFNAALLEEIKETAEFFGDEAEPEWDESYTDIISKIKSDGGPMWGLFSYA
eukprot:TRINITY_DN7658_c1_g1_i1.p1 TRINITY_DN7658_c1_g1~~TRINITY_DN7658_c1_g1_i1.p1  ORF type:complete len:470 (+),score=162.23 TRINITY_DN7658_c1_g1_i1:120-1412(+)